MAADEEDETGEVRRPSGKKTAKRTAKRTAKKTSSVRAGEPRERK